MVNFGTFCEPMAYNRGGRLFVAQGLNYNWFSTPAWKPNKLIVMVVRK
jgi:hypothetical protein